MENFEFSMTSPLTKEELDGHIYNLATRGYSLLQGFLFPDVIRVLKDSLGAVLNNYSEVLNSERSRIDRFQMHDLVARDIHFGKLLEDPRLDQLLSPLLGKHWIMYAMTSSSLPPMGTNYASRLHVDCPRFHPGYVFNVGVIWALDDYDHLTGPLKVLPGSQHSDINPGEELFENNCEKLHFKAGTLVIFNAKLYHRVSVNKSSSWRHALTLNACRSFMKQRMDWVRFVPDEIANQLNAQARRVLGFDTRLPKNLDEFFLPEDERLYKPGQG